MIPFTFIPLLMAVRTTARMAAFMPGASPPLVRTPIVFTCFAIVVSSCYPSDWGCGHISVTEALFHSVFILYQMHFFPYKVYSKTFCLSFQSLFHNFDILFTNYFSKAFRNCSRCRHMPVGRKYLFRPLFLQIDDHGIMAIGAA